MGINTNLRELLYTTWSCWCLDHRMKTTVREEKDRSAAGLPVLVSGTTPSVRRGRHYEILMYHKFLK